MNNREMESKDTLHNLLVQAGVWDNYCFVHTTVLVRAHMLLMTAPIDVGSFVRADLFSS